jgi:hypothetical protein
MQWHRKSDHQSTNVVNDDQHNQQQQQLQTLSSDPPKKRSIEEEIDSLSGKERACFELLKARWEERVEASKLAGGDDVPIFSDAMILCFARCAPMGPFHEASAWKIMKKCNARYLDLSFGELGRQLKTRVSVYTPTTHMRENPRVVIHRTTHLVILT